MTITISPKDEKESEKIKTILKAIEVDFVENISGKDWWDDLTDHQKKVIEEGLEDIKENRVISHADFLKSYESR